MLIRHLNRSCIKTACHDGQLERYTESVSSNYCKATATDKTSPTRSPPKLSAVPTTAPTSTAPAPSGSPSDSGTSSVSIGRSGSGLSSGNGAATTTSSPASRNLKSLMDMLLLRSELTPFLGWLFYDMFPLGPSHWISSRSGPGPRRHLTLSELHLRWAGCGAREARC